MADKQKRKPQDPEPDMIFTKEAEDIEDDASALEAENLEEEEVAEEGEEEELDEEVEEEESLPEPVKWQHLTAEKREACCTRVRAWLNEPQRETNQQVVIDLLDLAVDTLVSDAFKRFYKRKVERDAPMEHRGDQQEKFLEEVKASASHHARPFRDDLLNFVSKDKDAAYEVLKTTMDWWVRNRRTGSLGDIDSLLERCADQLAAVLVFKNLPPTEETRKQFWWDVLLQRVVQRVILPRLCGPVDEDRVSNCIVAILHRAQCFKYEGLGQAINFFTRACGLPENQQLPQVEIGPLPDLDPTDLHQFQQQLQRENLWSIMVQALCCESAVKKWVLFRLSEDRNRQWEEIAVLVLDLPGHLDDDDLPPGATWCKIQQAFQAMAQRARANPGTLNADALKQFESRAMRQLRQYAQKYPEARSF